MNKQMNYLCVDCQSTHHWRPWRMFLHRWRLRASYQLRRDVRAIRFGPAQDRAVALASVVLGAMFFGALAFVAFAAGLGLFALVDAVQGR